jgi:hypothetical protein
VGFSSFTTLMWTLVCQNSQYITLRCFLQLTASTTTNSREVLNLSICVFTLFVTIFLAVAMPFLMCSAKVSYCLLFDHVKPGVVLSALFVSVSSLMRAYQGFCHAWLHSNYNCQQICLFLGNAVCLIFISYTHKIFSSKSVYLCTISSYGARTLLHFLMVLEAYVLCPDCQTPIIIVQAFANLEWCLICVVLFQAIAEFICKTAGFRTTLNTSQ